MPPVKRILDLSQYVNVLPYASEMFGIYQPLLGWKSLRIAKRFEDGLARDKSQLLGRLEREIVPSLKVRYDEAGGVQIDIAAGTPAQGVVKSFDSIVLSQIAQSLPPYAEYAPGIWPAKITRDILDAILKKEVVGSYTKAYAQLRSQGGSNAVVERSAT
ncbi:MAG TPA: hypothetical protein VEQ59_09925, partial [Polyangiaceae bacterium]|nr:hypothetical protein [Polyangiaceae bacterium]